MTNSNNKMVEFDGVVVVIKGEEVVLSDLTYNEFSIIMNALEDDEIANVFDQIVDQAGEEAFLKFILHLQELAEEEMEEEGLDPKQLKPIDIKDAKELEEDLKHAPQPQQKEQTKPTQKQKAPILDPVKFVDMDNVFGYDPELLAVGIDEVTIQVGKYLAYVNAGLTNEQAYELITIEAKREHELTIAEKQLELERIKVEAQMRAGGIKQLLNR